MNNRQRQTLFASLLGIAGSMAGRMTRGMASSIPGRFWRFNKYGVNRTRQGEAAKDFPGLVTRQRIRARLRAESHAEINARFGPEPRRLRRVLALALARNRYRARTVGLRTKGAAA